MPIRVSCSCGQSLSVADAMAGKSGKCPKCGGIIRIPARSAATTPSPKPAPKASAAPKQAVAEAKPSKTVQPKPSAGGGALDQLFAEAGLDKIKGPECPSCQAPIDPSATLCVQCGMNLATGQKTAGLAAPVIASSDPAQFANRQLNDAKKSLVKEFEADEAAKYTGAPWWVSLAVVLGMITIIAFGVIMVEGFGVDADGESLMAPETTLKGKIQRLGPNVLLVVGALVSCFVIVMAWIATFSEAFREKASQGFLCLLVPFYAHYYCYTGGKKMLSTMKILWGWTVVWIALAITLVTTGTWQLLTK